MDSPRGRIVLMKRRPRGGRADRRRDGHALRPLPRLHGVRDRVPVGRAVRPAASRTTRAADRAPRGAPARPSARYRAAIFALFPHPGRLRALAPASRALGAADRRPDAPLGSPAPRLRRCPPGAAARRRARRLPDADARPRGERRGARRRSCRAASSACSSATSTRRPCACWRAEGCEVARPRAPRCCGALQHARRVEDAAPTLARATIDAFEELRRPWSSTPPAAARR